MAAFQQHDWLWQLLLRKHLPDLLACPAAAQLFADALAHLPRATQARAFRLWRQQLLAHPEPLVVPAAVQQLLLELLKRCFTARSLNLALLLPEEEGELGAQGVAAATVGAAPSAAASTSVDHAQAAGAEVHVALQEQLPHLLHLLLLLACSGGDSAGSSLQREGGSSGHASGNVADGPSLSSVQSAAVAGQVPSSSATAGRRAAPEAAASSSIRDSVLHCAVLLVSRLSDADALHEMLGIHLRQPAGARRSSDGDEEGSDGEGAATAEQHQEHQEQLLRRHREVVSTAATLIEVCLDGMLTLPPLASAIQQQLHSKGSSSAAAAAGLPDAAAAEEQQQAAVAELRYTAGLMLGMHRELNRFRLEQQPQEEQAGRQRQPVPLLSLPACRQLLGMLAELKQPRQQQQEQEQQDAGAASPGLRSQPKPPGSAGGLKGRFEVAAPQAALAQGPPALLLVPPQLAAQGIDLVCRVVEAADGALQQQQQALEGPDARWRGDMAALVAAMYATCYQAIWGAKVLQSAEAYQLLLSAARLRMLLRSNGNAAAAPAAADADAEAAAEAEALMQNAVGNRRRRQRSAAHELGGARAPAGGSAPPAPKRLKSEHSGTAVAELLQLFHPGVPQQPLRLQHADESQQGQQQAQQAPPPSRRRIMAVHVNEAAAAAQQQHAAASWPRKRITLQQIAPSTGTAAGGAQAMAGGKASTGGAGGSSAALLDAAGEALPAVGDAAAVAPAGVQQQQAEQRVRISRAAHMTGACSPRFARRSRAAT